MRKVSGAVRHSRMPALPNAVRVHMPTGNAVSCRSSAQNALTTQAARGPDTASAVAGTVTTGTPDIAFDLTFAAPSTAFSELLSLVPAIYAHDFDKLQTSGTMALNGQVKGKYGPKAFPALAIRAKVASVVTAADYGNFSLTASQIPTYSAFVPLPLPGVTDTSTRN